MKDWQFYETYGTEVNIQTGEIKLPISNCGEHEKEGKCHHIISWEKDGCPTHLEKTRIDGFKFLLEREETKGEAGFARVLNTLRGLVPSIKTITILTGENPNGKMASAEFNKNANEKLIGNLISGNFSYRKIKGKYENVENSFIVNNISKNDAMSIGKNFNQESIIFGERVEEGNYVGMKFKMIRTSPNGKGQIGEVMGEKDVFVNLDNPDDFYTDVKGRKFVIPFYGVIDDIKQGEDIKERIRDYENVKWDGGKATPNNVSISEHDIKEIENITENIIRTSGSSSYNYRGMLKQKLRKLGLL